MAKAHRAYRHSWHEKRFQQRGMFEPVTVTEHGWIFSNRVITQNEEGSVTLEPRQQLRWLRETLVKMDEAHAKEREFDLDYYSDDTIPAHRNLKAERIYAAAMGVTPRIPARAGVLDFESDVV